MVRDDMPPPFTDTALRVVPATTPLAVVTPEPDVVRLDPGPLPVEPLERHRGQAPVRTPRTSRHDATRLPLVVAHRGASGTLPENTLPAFARAITMGADAIEVDVVSTRDGRLVVRHEALLDPTTNVAGRDDLLRIARNRGREFDDAHELSTHDLDLRELARLRARQRSVFRPGEHDDLFMVPTFAQILGLVRRSPTYGQRPPAIHVELKDPAGHADRGLPLERELLRDLAAQGWNRADAPVVIQSFDSSSLLQLAGRTEIPLLKLARFDEDGLECCTDRGLEAVATYASAIGISRALLSVVGEDLILRAQHAGLAVHLYTFADDDPSEPDPAAAYATALELGADALITDFPDSAVAARDAWAELPTA